MKQQLLSKRLFLSPYIFPNLQRARLQREIKTLEEVSIKTWHSKLSVWATGEDTDFKRHIGPIVPLDVCRGGFKAK
ncbi:hypothetical protein CesoFtcFv8_006578 [Champsocephalus esox]|uniref:Uncharacterized protein n=1 Tax=Champsocephalus esox TaxID=159716 RepID=A0AAN8CK51_9TELE|nr:hypothetical protein CesoFtcFv8_006578 [Champsocephalus esox]